MPLYLQMLVDKIEKKYYNMRIKGVIQ